MGLHVLLGFGITIEGSKKNDQKTFRNLWRNDKDKRKKKRELKKRRVIRGKGTFHFKILEIVLLQKRKGEDCKKKKNCDEVQF